MHRAVETETPDLRLLNLLLFRYYNTGCPDCGEGEGCCSSCCCDGDSVGVVGAVAAVLFANTSP